MFIDGDAEDTVYNNPHYPYHKSIFNSSRNKNDHNNNCNGSDVIIMIY